MTAFHPAVHSPGAGSEVVAKGRDRIWDLSPNLHCSIVGTCLSTSDLRQLLGKLNEPDAKTASEHTLHMRAVRAAGQKDVAGKLLNKMLDRRHEAQLKRFAKAKTTLEVRRLWEEALERGDIPGAYWATLTHPAADRDLVQEVFGEVHMLSHLVGRTNRADIARLRRLEHELGERDEKIARQEARLQRAAHERADLVARLNQLEARLRTVMQSPHPRPAVADAASMVSRRLADEQARAALMTTKAQAHAHALKASREEIARLQSHISALQDELAAAGAAISHIIGEEASSPATPDLHDLILLYVGGRPKLVDQLRALTSRRGGVLLDHDGGVEENAGLLPGLISRCDAALFPVDCISHHAAERVKRFCRQHGKPFVALRSASLSSFAAAVATLTGSLSHARSPALRP
jgi:hypothetical protein